MRGLLMFLLLTLLINVKSISQELSTVSLKLEVEIDNKNHLVILIQKNNSDTIVIPQSLQSETYTPIYTSNDRLRLKRRNGSIISLDIPSLTWNTETKGLQIKEIEPLNQYTSNKRTPLSPFSNKILLPIYFILGSAMIYGLIRIILLKNEYDTKLNVEKLERGKLEEINQVKVNFYNMISHELKTPLTLIIGPIQELKEDENSEKKMILLDYVEKNASKLKTLIDEILDYKNHEFEYFDLNLELKSFNDLIQEISLNFKDNADRNSIDLALDINLTQPYIHFDSKLMELVLNNLIVNALKFAPINSSIEIVVWDDSNNINFSISDSGPGIPAKDIHFIFKKYYQGSNNPNKGNGIGLALSKEIVQKHLGNISVEVKNRKTIFTFQFPTNLDEQLPQYIDDNSLLIDQIKGLKKENSLDKDKTILIVDDNFEIRTYLNLHLQTTFNVIESENGEDGYNKAIEHVPDLIISDIAMPKMDGITMCSHVKSNSITDHIPVILLTARTRDKYLRRSLLNGADAYLTKPFDIHMLRQKVDNLLNQIEKIQRKVNSEINSEKENNVENVSVNKFVADYSKFVKDNFENPLFSTDLIAEAMNLSSSQCYRKIKSLTGFTPSQIIKTIKLEEAHKLLTNSDLPISQILSKLGLSDPKYFRKIFKEKYNKTPTEVRKSAT